MFVERGGEVCLRAKPGERRVDGMPARGLGQQWRVRVRDGAAGVWNGAV